MSGASSLRRDSLALMLANGAALLLAVAVQFATARAFGTSRALDAYVVAISAFTFLADWFLKDSSNMVLVPALKRAWAEPAGNPSAFAPFRSLLTFYVAFTLACVVACEVFAGPIVATLAPGFEPASRTLAKNVLRVSALVLLPALGACVARASLNAAGRFLLPTWGSAAQSAVTVACILLLAGRFGVWALPAGLLAGTGASLALQARAFASLRVPSLPGGALSEMKRFGALGAFLVIGLAAHVHVLADRFFASRLPEGSIAVLAYAEKFRFPVMALFALSVSIPAFTAFSGSALASDWGRIASDIRLGVRMIALATVPFVALVVCLRLPLTRLWLEHGSFGAGATRDVSAVLLTLSPAFVVNALSTLLLAAFFAIGAPWTVTWIVCAEMAAAILLAAALVAPLGVPGLGLATSIATAGSNVVLWRLLSRRMGGIGLKREIPFLARVAGATVAAAAVAVALERFAGGVFGLVLAGAAGAGVYVAAGAALGIDEIRSLLVSIRAHGRGRP